MNIFFKNLKKKHQLITYNTPNSDEKAIFPFLKNIKLYGEKTAKFLNEARKKANYLQQSCQLKMKIFGKCENKKNNFERNGGKTLTCHIKYMSYMQQHRMHSFALYMRERVINDRRNSGKNKIILQKNICIEKIAKFKYEWVYFWHLFNHKKKIF